eukprot:2522463-Alexandrium_andersonii.AAC.1
MSHGSPTHCWSSSMSVRLSHGSRRTDRVRTAPMEVRTTCSFVISERPTQMPLRQTGSRFRRSP